MQIIKNILLPDNYGRSIGTDIFFDEEGGAKPVIIYAHGFNGFKDWGNFDIIAKQFANAGFTFIKFNFSFNGTTPDTPEDFTDLEGYAENNYSKELDNLGTVIDWVCGEENPYAAYIDRSRLGLIGHSLGGGIVLLKAAEDRRVEAVATWASISECKTPWTSWTEEQVRAWRETGVQYIMNSRTHQNMPLHYQLYEDYEDNKGRLDISVAVERLHVPLLICHGRADTSVPIGAAMKLKKHKADAELYTVDSDHVFGRKHPWLSDELPGPMQEVVSKTIEFFSAGLVDG